ncbi:MAG: class II fructose-bisphosphate aldolase [Lachnospiraceae bacterium]|jgi:fructose-bisphosphate aldolase class II|nr:class II fructose-bisphosphate aldolase [Lachnospiraceae bacterium]
MLVTLKDILQGALAGGYAVAAPSVSTSVEVDAAVSAAEEMGAPIILDVHFEHDGKTSVSRPVELAHWMRSRGEHAAVPVAINMDIGGSFAGAVRSVRAGATSLALRNMPIYSEAVELTRKMSELAHAAGISSEGMVPCAPGLGYTDPQDAVRFVSETGVDCVAVSFSATGENGGMYLDLAHLAKIRRALGPCPLTLHGSLGADDEQLREACRSGINKVDIAKDLRKAAMQAVVAWDGAPDPISVAARGYAERLKAYILICGVRSLA